MNDNLVNEIILKAKKKIQSLDTERIVCYTISDLGEILSGRIISKNNQNGYSFLDINKFLNMIKYNNVASIILFHNHPNSTMRPSEDDDEMTKFMIDFCNKNNIEIYDHIIIMRNSNDVYSYRKNHRFIITKLNKTKPSVIVHKRSVNG